MVICRKNLPTFLSLQWRCIN